MGVLNENSRCSATDPYSTAKLKAEERCTNSPLCTTILRHSNIYGPGQATEFVIPFVIEQALRSNTIKLRNAGAASDFVYIDDALEAYEKVLKNPRKDTYNLCAGESTRIEEVVRVLSDVLDKKLDVISENYKDVAEPPLSNKKIRNHYGWTPKTSIKEGLAKTARDERRHIKRFIGDLIA